MLAVLLLGVASAVGTSTNSYSNSREYSYTKSTTNVSVDAIGRYSSTGTNHFLARTVATRTTPGTAVETATDANITNSVSIRVE